MTAEFPSNGPAQYDALLAEKSSLLYEKNEEHESGHESSGSLATTHLRVDSMDPQAQYHLKMFASRKRNGECDLRGDDDRQQVKHHRFLHKSRQESTNNADTPADYQHHDQYCLSIDDVMDKCYQENKASPGKNALDQEDTDPGYSPHSQDDQDDDPDWDVIARTNPASEYVPMFLAARDRRNEAEARFETALDLAHSNLKDLIDSLCGVAADVINGRRVRLDELEADIKHDFVENETKRDQMSKKLVQFAADAQAQFHELMNRLVNRTNGN